MGRRTARLTGERRPGRYRVHTQPWPGRGETGVPPLEPVGAPAIRAYLAGARDADASAAGAAVCACAACTSKRQEAAAAARARAGGAAAKAGPPEGHRAVADAPASGAAPHLGAAAAADAGGGGRLANGLGSPAAALAAAHGEEGKGAPAEGPEEEPAPESAHRAPEQVRSRPLRKGAFCLGGLVRPVPGRALLSRRKAAATGRGMAGGACQPHVRRAL